MSFAVEKSVFTSWRTSFALARLTPHVPAPSPPMRPNPSSSIAEAPMKEYRLALEKIEPAPWKPNVPYIVSALESMKAADENAAEKKKSFAKASNVPCTPSVLSGPFFMLPAKMRMMKATSKKSEATSKSTRASHKVSNARKSGGQVGQVNTGSSQPASVAKNARQATVSLPIGYPGSGGQVNTGSSQPAAAASNTIKNAAKITKAIPKKRKRRPSAAKKPAKKPDRGVPFEEMQRLMEVYGPTKCLRKRRPPSGGDATKADSVKRKFYRWFPDLEERFVRDDGGRWRPRLGHDVELRYREEMRKKDGESLARKRARRGRRGAAGGGGEGPRVRPASERAGRVPDTPVSPPAKLPSPPGTPCVLDEKPVSSLVQGKPDIHEEVKAVLVEEDCEVRLDFDHDLGLGSDPIVTDAAPLEGPFLAEGIFGDAEGGLCGLA